MSIETNMEKVRKEMGVGFEGIDAVRYQNDGFAYEGYRKFWETKMQNDIDAAVAKGRAEVEAERKAKAERRAIQLKQASANPDTAEARAQFLTATCVSIPQLLRLAEQAGLLARGVTNHCLEAAISVVTLLHRMLQLTSPSVNP